MSVITDATKDKRGVVRGECRGCPEDCKQYALPRFGHSCEYCGCPAGNHVRLPERPELLTKIEPEEDDGETGTPTAPARPQPGPSKRTEIQMREASKPTKPQTRTAGPVASVDGDAKRCRQLYEDEGVNYDKLPSLDKQMGVFTIRYEGKVIYFGHPMKTPLKASLRSIFRGGHSQDISKFIERKKKEDKLHLVKVAWLKQLKDDPHDHTCMEGKKHLSYRQCITKLQGENPRVVLLSLCGKRTVWK